MMTITARLSAYAAGLTLDALPPEVVERTRFLMLDLVGCIVRARHDVESTAPLLSTVRALGLHTGTSGVFGDEASTTGCVAAHPEAMTTSASSLTQAVSLSRICFVQPAPALEPAYSKRENANPRHWQ